MKIVGILLLVLSSVHLIFPRYFKWKTDLKRIELINRQLLEVHTFYIALTVAMIGLLCLGCSSDLLSTQLGQVICYGLSFFWGTRFIIQFVWYSPKLWKGKTFETVVHIAFSIVWLYLTVFFFAAGYNN